MAARQGTKTITKTMEMEEPPRQNPAGQGKRPESGQFRLQVDRQTKSSYATYDAAEAAGLAIKREHPIVQVAVYDARGGENKILELPKD